MFSFFSLSKITWFLISPDHLLIWWLLLGLVAVLCNRRRLAITLLGLEFVFVLLLALFPLGNLVMHPLETRFPQPQLSAESQVDGVLVLGGGEEAGLMAVWGAPQFNAAAERFMVMPSLARQFPKAQLVFSGGSGSVLQPQARGADVAKAWLDSIGVDKRVIYERDSRNTYENIRNTIKQLGGVPKGRWLLVTSGYHMPRSIGICRQQGWDITPYPVDFYTSNASGLTLDPSLWPHLRDLVLASREWVGLVAYRLTGKTATLFPAPQTVSQE